MSFNPPSESDTVEEVRDTKEVNLIKTVESINMRSLLKAGTFYGHRTDSWHPEMKKYIIGKKKYFIKERYFSTSSHFIDLRQTLSCWRSAKKVVQQCASGGGSFLFVIPDTINFDISLYQEPNTFFITKTWKGGLLTNHRVIINSIEKLKRLEKIVEEALDETNEEIQLGKREITKLEKKIKTLNSFFGGVREMTTLPDVVVIFNCSENQVAIEECKKLGITTIGICDTNVNPNLVDYPIPGNDDNISSIQLFLFNILKIISEENIKQIPAIKELIDPINEMLNQVAEKDPDLSGQLHASDVPVSYKKRKK